MKRPNNNNSGTLHTSFDSKQLQHHHMLENVYHVYVVITA